MAQLRIRQPHLERRADGFYWRRRWPKAGASELPRATLSRRMGQIERAEARALARDLTALSDRVFAEIAQPVQAPTPSYACNVLTQALALRATAAALRRALARRHPAAAENAEQAIRTGIEAALCAALRTTDTAPGPCLISDVARALGLAEARDRTDATKLFERLYASRVRSGEAAPEADLDSPSVHGGAGAPTAALGYASDPGPVEWTPLIGF